MSNIKTTDKERNKKKQQKIYLIIGIVGYVYFVLAALQYSAIRLADKRISMSDAIDKAVTYVITKPFNIFPIKLATLGNILLISIGIGAIATFYIIDKRARKADNPDTVNGEAHLMTLEEYHAYCMKFVTPYGKVDLDGFNNMILSKDMRLAMDNRGTRRNMNILVIGGSGAGKTRFFGGPNILQYNCNFVITDPSGEMLRDYGKALENEGYAVKVINLTDVLKSNRYNPFHYIKDEKDVFILVNTLIKNTNPDGKGGGDPFWEKSENLLMTALILYLWHNYEEKDQTFANVMKLLGMAEVDENDPNKPSRLDILFDDLKKKDPNNLAVRQYSKFKMGAGKTLKSILISVGVRLQTFELSELEYLTSADDLHLETFADTKQALFVITPTGDNTFAFIVSMLYSQLFSTLYSYCERFANLGWKLNLDQYTTIHLEQARNHEESAEAEKKIRALEQEIKTKGVIVGYKDRDGIIHKNAMHPDKKLFYVYSAATQTLLGWRGSKEKTQAFINKLRNIKVEQSREACAHHVRFILDEFANIGEIPEFDEKLSTVRKYEISCSIILQALSQLKVIYKDKWNTIVGNCDTKLFLGSDDQETIEWMLKMLGKKTTRVRNTSQSYGKSGNASESINLSSQDLLTIDQISMMQDNECLVRIRGVRPFYGKKFELTDHKNYKSAMEVRGKFFIPIAENAPSYEDLGTPLYIRERRKREEAKKKSENDFLDTGKNESKSAEKEKSVVEKPVKGPVKEPVNVKEPDMDIDDYAEKLLTSAIQDDLDRSNSNNINKKKEEKKSRDAKNKARKMNALENAGEIMEEEPIPDRTIEDLAAEFGLTEYSTDEEIKTCVETMFDMDNFLTDDELIYTMCS